MKTRKEISKHASDANLKKKNEKKKISKKKGGGLLKDYYCKSPKRARKNYIGS